MKYEAHDWDFLSGIVLKLLVRNMSGRSQIADNNVLEYEFRVFNCIVVACFVLS